MYIRNPRIIALLYFETCFQKIRIFQKWGWDGMGSKNGMVWNRMRKNGMKQVEYCYEGFDNKTLFLHISFTLIETQIFTVIL